MDAQLQQSWDWQTGTKHLYNNWKKSSTAARLRQAAVVFTHLKHKKAWALKWSYQQKKEDFIQIYNIPFPPSSVWKQQYFSKFINSQPAAHTLGEFMNIAVPWDPWEVVFLLTLHRPFSSSGVNLAALLSQTANMNTTVPTSTSTTEMSLKVSTKLAHRERYSLYNF